MLQKTQTQHDECGLDSAGDEGLTLNNSALCLGHANLACATCEVNLAHAASCCSIFRCLSDITGYTRTRSRFHSMSNSIALHAS